MACVVLATAEAAIDVEAGPEADEPGDGGEEVHESWPMIQAKQPRVSRYFCFGRRCGCCPAYIVCIVPLAVVVYVLGFICLVSLGVLGFVVYMCCGYPAIVTRLWLKSWSLEPWGYRSSLYVQLTYLAYQYLLLRRGKPTTGPEGMPISQLRPKEKLVKVPIHYAVNIQVPRGTQEEFTKERASMNLFVQWLEEHFSESVTLEDDFTPFAPGEDPVKFAMKHVGSVYPFMHQVWEDKQSDRALTRFCLYGLGAHRVQVTELDGRMHFVLRADMLSNLPVRPGYERYGGDAYFDMNWRPVQIVDTGSVPLQSDGCHETHVFRPGQEGWDRAKFRFRSSLAVLVTLVDHLYGTHLQASNIFVTALREQLSPEHPVRRFMTPFTYQAVSVNDNASNNLAKKDSMGPRCFGFTDIGIQMAFASARKLLLSGFEVPKEEGGPILDRVQYVGHLKSKGVDTEYFRQTSQLVQIYRRFVRDYMNYYYPLATDVLLDQELRHFLRQYFNMLEIIDKSELHIPFQLSDGHDLSMGAEAIKEFMIILFAETMFVCTAGHEQVGEVAPYVQDVSFCAFRWVPGARIGTKQTATNQATLMSFTSTPMPELLGADWTHLFPEKASPPEGAKSPAEAFRTFQEELEEMAQQCDHLNETCGERPFPDCFPLWTVNPRFLNTSISV